MGFQVCRIWRGTFAYPYPGRSTRESFPLIRKKLISCVRPGVELILARFFRLTNALINEDFPTLDFPAMANSGSPPLGYSDGLEALFTTPAEKIFTGFVNPFS